MLVLGFYFAIDHLPVGQADTNTIFISEYLAAAMLQSG